LTLCSGVVHAWHERTLCTAVAWTSGAEPIPFRDAALRMSASPRGGRVVVARFASAAMAEIARLRLLGAGIDADVSAENASGWRPELEASLGVEVRVAARDRESAEWVLRVAERQRRDRPAPPDRPGHAERPEQPGS
jgi:hypothetical protein